MTDTDSNNQSQEHAGVRSDNPRPAPQSGLESQRTAPPREFNFERFMHAWTETIRRVGPLGCQKKSDAPEQDAVS